MAASVYDLLLWVPVELGTGYLSRLLGVAPGNYSRFSRIVDRGYDRDQSPINTWKTRRSLFVIKYTNEEYDTSNETIAFGLHLILLTVIGPIVLQMMVGLLFGQAEDTVRTICVYSVSSGLTNVTTTLVELGYFLPIFYNVGGPDENNGVDGYQACTGVPCVQIWDPIIIGSGSSSATTWSKRPYFASLHSRPTTSRERDCFGKKSGFDT